MYFELIMKSEVWKKKSLILDFAISDLKNRYRNSVLGFVWTLLEPLFILLVLYVVFTNIFKSSIEYFPLYLLLGLIMWNMFVRGTQLALNSLHSRGPILSQIRIPTEIPSISSSLTSLFMLTFEMIVFGIFLIAFHFIPPLTAIILPLIIGLEFILVLGISLPLSVLNIRFRDTQFIWAVVIQAGFFLTPIFYRLDILPIQAQNILVFSPMVQILNFAHDATLYGRFPTTDNIAIAVGTTFLVLLIGYAIFRKLSHRIIEEL
jgi:lipopolysaccharide transport system permease protein